MTISEAIAQIDSLQPNKNTDAQKIQWLSELDSRIQREVINTHKTSCGCVLPFQTYTEEDMDLELMAEEPYDQMYIHWLEAKIDYWQKEMDRYDAALSSFLDIWTDFSNEYNRTHEKVTKQFRY